uniref:Uncharacterized protein n=1 Tax=Rhizophagus irregularis (strain DAOM 181602 / DAOM 197198 / MUCL 43194) TaxID=747089 RepID=U9USD3_RHIID
MITYIQEYLIEHQTEFLNQNPIEILETVNQHETFTELLLKRDDLYMDEIEIWIVY